MNPTTPLDRERRKQDQLTRFLGQSSDVQQAPYSPTSGVVRVQPGRGPRGELLPPTIVSNPYTPVRAPAARTFLPGFQPEPFAGAYSASNPPRGYQAVRSPTDDSPERIPVPSWPRDPRPSEPQSNIGGVATLDSDDDLAPLSQYTVIPATPVREPTAEPANISQDDVPGIGDPTDPADDVLTDPPLVDPSVPAVDPGSAFNFQQAAQFFAGLTKAMENQNRVSAQQLQFIRSLTLPTQQPSSAPAPRDDKLGRDPDVFTGKDPTKLMGFFVACEAVFLARRSTFSGPDGERRKVYYALTFLRDDARAWFDKYIMEGDIPNPPLFMVNWRAFLAELLAHFGPANAVRDAERALETIVMTDKQHIERYDIDFMRYAALVGWNDAALCHRYRAGLPDRIKDLFQFYPAYQDLEELREYASAADHRHWERVAERRSE